MADIHLHIWQHNWEQELNVHDIYTIINNDSSMNSSLAETFSSTGLNSDFSCFTNFDAKCTADSITYLIQLSELVTVLWLHPSDEVFKTMPLPLIVFFLFRQPRLEHWTQTLENWHRQFASDSQKVQGEVKKVELTCITNTEGQLSVVIWTLPLFGKISNVHQTTTKRWSVLVF